MSKDSLKLSPEEMFELAFSNESTIPNSSDSDIKNNPLKNSDQSECIKKSISEGRRNGNPAINFFQSILPKNENEHIVKAYKGSSSCRKNSIEQYREKAPRKLSFSEDSNKPQKRLSLKEEGKNGNNVAERIIQNKRDQEFKRLQELDKARGLTREEIKDKKSSFEYLAGSSEESNSFEPLNINSNNCTKRSSNPNIPSYMQSSSSFYRN